MLTHHAQHPTSTHRYAPTRELRRDDLTVQRARPSPSTRRPATSHERLCWWYLASAAALTVLVPVAAAVGIAVAGSTGFHLFLALAIPVVTGTAVAASGAASDPAPTVQGRGPRTR